MLFIQPTRMYRRRRSFKEMRSLNRRKHTSTTTNSLESSTNSGHKKAIENIKTLKHRYFLQRSTFL